MLALFAFVDSIEWVLLHNISTHTFTALWLYLSPLLLSCSPSSFPLHIPSLQFHGLSYPAQLDGLGILAAANSAATNMGV